MKLKLFGSFVTVVIMIFSLCSLLPMNTIIPIEANAVTSADLSISQNGIAFIKAREGFSRTCYYDGAQSSIGYGTKCGTTAHSSGQHSITEAAAEEAMMKEINNQYIPNIRKQTSGIEMNQNQFDALVSFTYNTGGGTTMIKNSPLVKYLLGELTESQARSEFSNYVVTNSATKKKDQGLVNRRNYEADLFFSSSQLVPSKWYEGLSPINLGDSFCALISNSTTDGYLNNEGWNVSAYPGDLSNKQAWIFNRQSDNSYVIMSAYDTNKLTVYNQEDADCASIIVTADDNVDIYQSWFIYETSKGYIFRPAYSERVMDLDGLGYAAGTNIWLYDFNDSAAQYYNITKKTWYDFYTPTDLGTNFCATINNNTTGGYLQDEGWNVAAYSGTNKNDQTWFFVKQSDGSYVINSLLDNARLTPYNNESNNYTSVIVSHDDVSKYQKWNIYKTNKGYIFRPIYSDKVIDINGGGYESGTNVQLFDFNGTYAQFYSINPTTFSYTIKFDANSGSCSTSDKYVNYGEKYGTLPTPAKTGYTFIGWYTSENSGTKITADTKVTITDNQTLYAHWEKINVLGDSNDDGEFNVADVVMLQKWLLNAGDLTNWQNADLYEDGIIDVFDLVLMKRKLIYG